MSIEDRNLKPGTVLVARYKKQDHPCEVVAGEEGKVRYRLKGGREYDSPSAAGSAVMGGTACNGWRFWSVEGSEPKASRKDAATKATPKTAAKKTTARKASAKKTATKKARPKAKSAAKVGNPNGAKAQEPEAPTEKPVGCGDCGQEFPNSREAAKHMQDEHGSVPAQPGDTQ
ncbi:MAG: hypothetical protein WBD55_06250 [Dehalococcoidia bacterium]